MVEYTLLKLIDTKPELFTHNIENFNNPLASYIETKLCNYTDYPLYGLREIKYNI